MPAERKRIGTGAVKARAPCNVQRVAASRAAVAGSGCQRLRRAIHINLNRLGGTVDNGSYMMPVAVPKAAGRPDQCRAGIRPGSAETESQCPALVPEEIT